MILIFPATCEGFKDELNVPQMTMYVTSGFFGIQLHYPVLSSDFDGTHSP